MLKAVLFDLDDTLLDWSGPVPAWHEIETPHLRRVYDYVHSDMGPLDASFEHFADEYSRRAYESWTEARSTLRAPHIGRILLDALEAVAAPRDRLDETTCLQKYQWGRVPGTAIFPDVPQVLQKLAEAGLRSGIVTNAAQPMWMRDTEIEQHGILSYFPECRFSAADVGYLKPHPNIFQTALDCLGLKADEVIFVGDNPVADIAGAQAAGMRAVLRVRNPAPPLISGLIVPDGAINGLMELLPLLDEWFPGWC